MWGKEGRERTGGRSRKFDFSPTSWVVFNKLAFEDTQKQLKIS